jgi:hypothetical protein
LRELIAPVIAPADPGGVAILSANWWPGAATFAWSQRSIPAERSRVLAGEEEVVATPAPVQDRAMLVAQLDPSLAAVAAPSGGLVLGEPGAAPLRLADFPPDQLSNFLATMVQHTADVSAPEEGPDPEQRALYALAADDVARDPVTRAELGAAQNREAELETLAAQIRARYDQHYAGRAGAPGTLWGPFDFLQNVARRAGEVLDRAADLPGDVATRVAGPLLKDVNAHFGLFLADILAYVGGRGEATRPGQIPTLLLDGLVRARENQRLRGGEPIVVLSHSMGGQLVYDAVTAYLPNATEERFRDIRIDFWCAAASQVAYFQELKQFVGSRPDDEFGEPPRRQVPFPDRRYLGAWWNVWDRNDYLSFTAREIFVGEVQDEAFSSGLSGLEAHGGYLVRPGFFRTFAERLREAKARNWNRG